MSEIIALVGKAGLPLIPTPNSGLRLFQPTAPTHLERYLHGVNGSAPVIRGGTTLILDSRIFEGGALGIKMRDYLKTIRNKYPDVRILCLRQDIENKSHEHNDIRAGATATLFYMGNISDATRRMNAFMDTGELPKPRQGRSSAVVSESPFNDLFHHAGDASDDEGALGSVEPVKPVARSSPVTQALQSSRATTQARSSMVSAPKTSPKSKPIAPPTSTEEPVLGDQEMEALLAILKTLTGQNTQILTALGGIQSSIDSLRAEGRDALLAEIQGELGTVFTQLRKNNLQGTVGATPVITPSPTTSPATPEAVQQTTPAPEKKAGPLATVEKLPGKDRKGHVTFCGKAVTLPFDHARLFAHLINTGETMGKEEVCQQFGVTKLVGGGYLRSLVKELAECKKGLSSCLTLVKQSRSKRYRFDIDAFRKAFGMNP